MANRSVNPHVVVQVMGAGAILMNTENGDCFELNRVGSEIWSELQSGRSVAEISETIARRYSIEMAKALTDVTSLIDALTRHGILIPKP